MEDGAAEAAPSVEASGGGSPHSRDVTKPERFNFEKLDRSARIRPQISAARLPPDGQTLPAGDNLKRKML
jgi:hypothetical protein